MSYPVISSNPAVQQFYLEMRQRGESHQIAEICALRSTPYLNGTDTAFFAGRWNNRQFDEMPPWLAQEFLNDAKAAGINTTGKVYISQMADSRGAGDPAAWVSGRDDVKRFCQENNVGCRGSVRHRAYQEPPAKPKVRLAPDIVNRLVEERVQQDPGLASKRAKVAQEVIEHHAPPEEA